MAGEIWSTMFLLFVLVIETVLGKASTYEHNTAVVQRTPPCQIIYHRKSNNQAEHGRNKTRMEVYISSPWMRHKGCYFDSQEFKKKKQDKLKYNSPGHCSLFCESSGYLGLRDTVCICLESKDLENKTTSHNCHDLCPYPKSHATCGSNDNTYFDVYELAKDFQQVHEPVYNVEDEDDTNKTCMVVKWISSNVSLKAVSCYENHSIYGPKDLRNIGKKTKAEAAVYTNFQNIRYDWKIKKDNIPENKLMWMAFNRSTIIILDKWIKNKQEIINNSKCNLVKEHSWSTGLLSLTSTEDKHFRLRLSCNIAKKSMCKVENGDEKRSFRHFQTSYSIPMHTGKQYNLSATTAIGLQYTSEPTTTSAGWKITMPTRVERINESTVENPTSLNECNTTNNPFVFDNSVFALQLGLAISVSCFVILIATLACCIYRPQRGTYTFPISRSEENIVMAVEGDSHQPTAVLADNYSDPIDISSTSNEVEGPRFCTTKPCQNTQSERTENGEYHHLDFTLRSETAKRFADTSEYDHVRGNVVSVFDQPWDTATSKVNKLFSQISKSVVQKGQNVRKSLIKRRVSRSGSPKLKNRASNYCEAWKTQLNNQQFVLDSNVDNQSDTSIDVENSPVDSKDKPKLRRTDSAFPVLPFSERISVKSTHINDEPDDRRMSLRERLLHMISIRPLKMPFGIELDLRASRSKSKIYSLATSIEEIDESVA